MSEQWVAGINAVREALEHGFGSVREVLIDARARNPRLDEIAELAGSCKASVQRVNMEVLDQRAQGVRHQGVVAALGLVPRQLGEGDLDELLAATSNPLILVLDGVQDPHNLGACLRSAEAAGVTAVVVPRDRAVGITPVVRKVAAGAADRVPLIRVANLARSLRRIKDAGVWLVGLAGESTQSLYALDLSGPIAIVLGAEGDGMRRLTRELCDFAARIPLHGQVESLNVSVATGVALFEVMRQRREPVPRAKL